MTVNTDEAVIYRIEPAGQGPLFAVCENGKDQQWHTDVLESDLSVSLTTIYSTPKK